MKHVLKADINEMTDTNGNVSESVSPVSMMAEKLFILAGRRGTASGFGDGQAGAVVDGGDMQGK